MPRGLNERGPQALQRGGKIGITERCGITSGHHHQVQPLERGPALAEAFAHQALDPVAVNGAAQLLAGDRQAEARGLAAVAPGENGETAVLNAARPLEDTPELAGLQQSGGAGEPLSQGGQ